MIKDCILQLWQYGTMVGDGCGDACTSNMMICAYYGYGGDKSVIVGNQHVVECSQAGDYSALNSSLGGYTNHNQSIQSWQ